MDLAFSTGQGTDAIPLLLPTEALVRGFALDTSSDAGALADHGLSGVGTSQDTLVRQGFRIGPLGLMIPYEHGHELTDLPDLYRMPNAPRWFRGMANLHGTLVAVFDPVDLLEVQHPPATRQMLLVLGHGDIRAALVIDGLPVRLRVARESRLEDAPIPQALEGCVHASYRADGADWMDLDFRPWFEDLEARLAR